MEDLTAPLRRDLLLLVILWGLFSINGASDDNPCSSFMSRCLDLFRKNLIPKFLVFAIFSYSPSETTSTIDNQSK